MRKRQTRRGNVYDVRLRTPDGRQLSKVFRTRKAADRFEAAQIADMTRGTWIDPRGLTLRFGEFAVEWLRRDPSKRPATIARDESVLRNHILPALGNAKLGSVTPRDVQNLVNAWSTSNAPNTVRRQFDVLRAIFSAAVELELIGRSPCRAVRLPSRQEPKRPMPTAVHLARLAQAIGPEWEAMIWLASVLGLRWGECAGLRLGRIDFERSRVRIVEQVTRGMHGFMVPGPPKSKAGSRTLSAPAPLLDALRRHIEVRHLTSGDGEALLFSEEDGGYLDYSNWRSRVWVPACKTSGLQGLVFHDLRRLNATALVLEGVDLKTAQTRLGHSDPRLTIAVYAQASTEADRDAANRLAGRLMGVEAEPGGGLEDTACAKDVPWIAEPGDADDTGADIIQLSRAKSGRKSREGGIRTRDLSVPNAAR